MAEMNLGPNGGLVYAMEYLVENIDWLQVGVAVSDAKVVFYHQFEMLIAIHHQDELGEYEDDYYIFDCPGQIELYKSLPLHPSLRLQLSPRQILARACHARHCRQAAANGNASLCRLPYRFSGETRSLF
jgi:hypothetical protein